MALTFARGHTIHGVPATNMKTALRSYSKGKHAARFLLQKSIFPSVVHAAHAYEIATATNLIDTDARELTEVGRAVAQSRSITKQPIRKARETLTKFLDHIATVNADPDRDITIERIYLYGSVMRNDPTVGDIDLQIEVERGPKWAKNFDGFYAAMTDLVAEYSPSYNDHGMMGAIDKGFEYIVFGQRKPQILAGAQINAGQLELIPAPCQLIYTSVEGVDLDAPIKPNHPDYNPDEEGSDQAARISQLPEAQIDATKPIDARFISQHNPRGWIGLMEFAPTYEDNIYLQMLHQYCEHIGEIRLLTGTEQNIEIPEQAEAVIPSLDTRNKIMLAEGQMPRAFDTSLIATRKNTICDQALTVEMTLSDFTVHSRKKTERRSFFAILITAACIHAADRFHAEQLQAASSNPLDIKAAFDCDASICEADITTARAISNLILDHLRRL